MLKKVLFFVCIISLLLSSIQINHTQAKEAPEVDPPTEAAFASDQLIIKLRPEARVENNTLSTHVSSLDKALTSINAIALVPLIGLPGTYILKMRNDANILTSVETLNKEPAVEYAEPDYLAKFASVPDDPRYSEQWGLSKIAVEGAWDQSMGSPSIVIAVIDSGIDLAHEDLAPNLWVNPGEIPGNGLDDDNNTFIDDVQGWNFVDSTNNVQDYIGHGSLVSGVAAAKMNNMVGIAGVCGNCHIMPVKVSQISGFANYSDIAAGVAYATQKGARVINISLGGYANSTTLRNAITTAVSQNIVVVAGAGNDNSSSPFYPAAYENVIAVAGTDQNDLKTISSNFGTWVDVSAPGQDILSTTLGDYSSDSGTSYAAPFVSGAAGLLLSMHPEWTPAMIRGQFYHTSDNIDNLNPGYEGLLGAGRLNATLAMQPPQPILTYQSYTGNGVAYFRPDFGSTVDLTVSIFNDWSDAAGVTGTLSCTDSYVTITTPSADFGSILAGETKANSVPFSFDIAAGAGYNHAMPFELLLSANDGAYSTSVSFTITTRSSEEPVSGTIAQNRTWTNDKTYVVTNNVGLAPGYTLIIEAGTTIKFNGNYSLNLGGTLVAQGTVEQPILFEPYTSSITWNRIFFDNTSLDAQTTADGDYLSGNVLQYVTLSSASGGIACSSATPFLENVTTDKGGVSCALGETDLWVKDSTFFGPVDISQGGSFPEHVNRVVTNGGDVVLPASQVIDSTLNGQVFINGAGQVSNTVNYGLSISGLADVANVTAKGSISISTGQVVNSIIKGGGVSAGSNSLISECTLTGGGISAGSGSTITHNNIENTGDNGIFGSGSSIITFNRVIGMAHGIITSSGIVENNLVANTSVNGIRPGTASIRNNTLVMNEGNAIYLDQIPTNLEGNNIEFNTGEYDVYVQVLVSPTPSITATNNWWGTTDLNQIRERTFDFYDEYTLAALLVEPLLESPSQNAPGYVRGVTLDPESPIGIQTVNFTVEFSRPMDVNFNPEIEFSSDWMTKSPMPTARAGLGVTSACNGKIYAIGGNNDYYSAVVEEYNPETDTWTAKSPMPTKRVGLGVTSGINGKIYAIGGSGDNPTTSSVEEFDPDTDTWLTKTSMPAARVALGVTSAMNGKIYAFGGLAWVVGFITTADVYEYDPETDTWVTKSPMPTARAGLGVASASNGKIYAIGGGGGDTVVEEYDPVTDTWTTKSPMPTTCTVLGVASASNGSIYVIGEAGGATVIEEYNPETDTWVTKSPNSPMPTARAGLGVASSADGKIYLIGGSNQTGNLNLVEVFGTQQLSINNSPQWVDNNLYSVSYEFSSLVSRDSYILSVRSAVGLDGMLIPPFTGAEFVVDYAGGISDTTPPDQPLVLAWGNNNLSGLSAYAYSEELDSQITGYRYAIGTTPGSVDVVNWTNISQNRITHTGLSLLPDQAYYVSFQARNEGGLWSPVGVSNPVVNGAGLKNLYMPLITR